MGSIMRFSWHGLGVAGLLAALPACGASGEAGTGGGGGGEPPIPTDHATVGFDDPGTLALSPGDVAKLSVTGDPPAAYRVGFSLLGQPLDAWLDHPTVTADGGGHASCGLHAPAQATTFHVRASLLDENGAPGPSADRAVAVSDQGFAGVAVTPVYDGHRTVTEWTVSVVANTSCNDVLPKLPDEPPGALTVTAPAGGTAVVDKAPVGADLAVVARAGHFAWGCSDTKALTPGDTLAVSVSVFDKALDLSSGSLDTTFSWPATTPDLATLFAHATFLLGEAFIPSGSKDGAVVLNAMAALVPPASMADFNAQRINKGWDAIANAHFAAISPGLRQQLTLWTTAGLAMEPPSFEAMLTAGADPMQPSVTVLRFGSVDPAAAGVASGAAFSWSTEPNDQMLIAGSIGWEPTRYAGAAALPAAKVDVPSAASVGDALAAVGDCHGLGLALGGYGTCDAGCMEQLCGSALDARFGTALGASAKTGQLGKLSLKATAEATVGDMAEPVALTGKWIGDIGDVAVDVALSGDLTAKSP
jgi:hypothetical protein